jgi:hypothetical protein
VGYLTQEPHLDETRTGRNVSDGAAAAQAIQDRYDELCGKLRALFRRGVRKHNTSWPCCRT